MATTPGPKLLEAPNKGCIWLITFQVLLFLASLKVSFVSFPSPGGNDFSASPTRFVSDGKCPMSNPSARDTRWPVLSEISSWQMMPFARQQGKDSFWEVKQCFWLLFAREGMRMREVEMLFAWVGGVFNSFRFLFRLSSLYHHAVFTIL